MNERVSIILGAYNHEKFAEEAVRSIFDQTYRPLELIVFDDASKDGTRSVLNRALERPPAGVAVIRLDHSANQGLAQSLNEAVAMATSRVIVLAAADDIMQPRRVELTLKEFDDPRVRFVHAGVVKIDENGALVPRAAQKGPPRMVLSLAGHLKGVEPPVIGASCAYHREVFSVFSPLDKAICQEDVILPLRGLLLGEGRYLDQTLVRYRTHSGNLHSVSRPGSSRELVRRILDFMPNRAALCRQLFRDEQLLVQIGVMPPASFSDYVSRMKACSDLEQGLAHSPSLLSRSWRLLRAFFQGRVSFRTAVKLAAIFMFPASYAFFLRLRIRIG